MAHIQKRCTDCRRTVPGRSRSCSACGGDVAFVARLRVPGGQERSKSFARSVDAEQFLTAETGKVQRGEWVPPELGKVTVKETARRWLAGKDLKPKTSALYEGLLRSRVIPTFGDWPLSSVHPSDVQAWVAAMRAEGLSASRIRQAHVVLSAVLSSALRDGALARNPAGGAELPRLPSEEAAYFEPSVVERIAVTLPESYGLLVRIMGTLGPRFGEAAALRRRSVNLLTRRLLIAESLAEVSGRLTFGTTKTHAVRRVPLTASLGAALEEHLESVASDPEALLFTAPEGGPLRYSIFRSRVWAPALARLGLPPVGIHALRHSAAAALISSGASPKAVQTILGHRSAAFTLTVYGHLFDADLDDVAARLDALRTPTFAALRGTVAGP